ncbi:MAG: hypothetical protein IKX41_01945 [Oscillospiraceae bacterium]|nr:hypothetical protein [Oscillospiraceae bacterium]
MEYSAHVDGREASVALEKEGLRLGGRFLDYSEVASLRPLSHRVYIDLLGQGTVEISMLGHSYDGFWEELCDLFGKRSLEALFVEEKQLMLCEGEYETPRERGRAKIALYEDSVCILPPTCGAVRIPLCFASEITLDGYLLRITLASGAAYTVGRMGYDTKPFAERTAQASERVKKQRAAALAAAKLTAPFTVKGLFRTAKPEEYWQAAFGKGRCALELFTGEDAATYLYEFSEPEAVFASRLAEAMEATGTHREMIYLTDEQLGPLYRMSVLRSEAVAFLRSRSAGRLIHSANHAQRLAEFLA